jgi:hypothetical protein
MSKLWTDEAVALTRKIVQFQDKLTASLGIAIHWGIEKRNYGLVIKLLGTIQHEARLLEHTSQDLMDLRPRRRVGGRPPVWFGLATDSKFFAIDTQKTVYEIQKEINGNYWKIVETLLRERLKKCRKLQNTILSTIPRQRQQTDEFVVLKYASELLDTLEIGEAIGGRGRRHRRR